MVRRANAEIDQVIILTGKVIPALRRHNMSATVRGSCNRRVYKERVHNKYTVGTLLPMS